MLGAVQRQLGGPELGAVFRIEGADFFVARAGAEDEAAGGHHGAAEVLLAGLGHAFRGEFGVLAERHFPDDFAGVEVEAIQRAPRRVAAGVALGIGDSDVAAEGVLRLRVRIERRAGAIFHEEEIEQRLARLGGELRLRRHGVLARGQQRAHLVLGQAMPHSAQRRRHADADAIRPVAGAQEARYVCSPAVGGLSGGGSSSRKTVTFQGMVFALM